MSKMVTQVFIEGDVKLEAQALSGEYFAVVLNSGDQQIAIFAPTKAIASRLATELSQCALDLVNKVAGRVMEVQVDAGHSVMPSNLSGEDA